MKTTAVLYLVGTKFQLAHSEGEFQVLRHQCDQTNSELVVIDTDWLVETQGDELVREITARINIPVDLPTGDWSNIRQWLAHVSAWSIVSQLPENITHIIILEQGQQIQLIQAFRLLQSMEKKGVYVLGHFALPRQKKTGHVKVEKEEKNLESKSHVQCLTCCCQNVSQVKKEEGSYIGGDSICKGRSEIVVEIEKNDMEQIGVFGYGLDRGTEKQLMQVAAGSVLKNSWLLCQPFQLRSEWVPIYVVFEQNPVLNKELLSKELLNPRLFWSHTTRICGGLVNMTPAIQPLLFDPRWHLKELCEVMRPADIPAFLIAMDANLLNAPLELYERLTHLALSFNLPTDEKAIFFLHWLHRALASIGSPHRVLALWHAAVWFNDLGAGDLAWMHLQEGKEEQECTMGLELSRLRIWQAHLDYLQMTKFEFGFELIRAGHTSIIPSRLKIASQLLKQMVETIGLSETQTLRMQDLVVQSRPPPGRKVRHLWSQWASPTQRFLGRTAAIILGSGQELEISNFAIALADRGWSVTIFIDSIGVTPIITNPRIRHRSELDDSLAVDGKFDVGFFCNVSAGGRMVSDKIYYLVLNMESWDKLHADSGVQGWFTSDTKVAERLKSSKPTNMIWTTCAEKSPPPTPTPLLLQVSDAPPKISGLIVSICDCCQSADHLLIEKFAEHNPSYGIAMGKSLVDIDRAEFAIHSGIPITDKCRDNILLAQRAGAIPIVLEHVDWKQSILAGYRCNFGFDNNHEQRWLVALGEIFQKRTSQGQARIREGMNISLERRKEWKDVLDGWEKL